MYQSTANFKQNFLPFLGTFRKYLKKVINHLRALRMDLLESSDLCLTLDGGGGVIFNIRRAFGVQKYLLGHGRVKF